MSWLYGSSLLLKIIGLLMTHFSLLLKIKIANFFFGGEGGFNSGLARLNQSIFEHDLHNVLTIGKSRFDFFV